MVNSLADNAASAELVVLQDSSLKKFQNSQSRLASKPKLSSAGSKVHVASGESKPVSTNTNQYKYKSGNQIVENYLNSLKRSGLANKNCVPVLKSSSIVGKRNFIQS